MMGKIKKFLIASISCLICVQAGSASNLGYSPYITTATSPDTPNARTISPGNNVFGTDGGAGSTYGVQAFTQSTVTSATTLTSTSNTVQLCSNSGSTYALTLPQNSTVANKVFWIKKTDNNTNQITVTPYSGDTIDGYSTYALNTYLQFICIQANGSGTWSIIATDNASDLKGVIPTSQGGTGAGTATNPSWFGANGSTTPAFQTSTIPTSLIPAINASGGANVFIGNQVDNFRLTFSTNTPVPTSDVTGATTIYFTPYNGNLCSVYNGTSWITDASAQISLALSTTSGKVYDVFVYDSSGTLTLTTLAWTSTTARATALSYQNGVLVDSANTQYRYVGSFYCTATNTSEDTAGDRALFNYYNRIQRPLAGSIATTSWTYGTNTWRAADANTTNGQGRVSYLTGVVEDAVYLNYSDIVTGGVSSSSAAISIGSNSTSSPSTYETESTVGDADNYSLVSGISLLPPLGYNYLQALESANGTATFQGTTYKCGLTGMLQD